MHWLSAAVDSQRRPPRRLSPGLTLLVLAALAACSIPPQPPVPEVRGHYKLGAPYQINGRWYYPEFDPNYDRTGVASWYGAEFHGLPTANGERFDRRKLTAAHPTLPLPSLVEVTNLDNGRRLVVRVNDRGPFVEDRLIDLSEAAAEQLGFRERGLARVRVRFLQLAHDAQGVPPAPNPGRSTQSRASSREALACTYRDHYLIQVGAFREPARAEQVAAQLKRLGPVRLAALAAAPEPMLRVHVGPVADGASALALLERVRALGFDEAFVLRQRTAWACDPAAKAKEVS